VIIKEAGEVVGEGAVIIDEFHRLWNLWFGVR